MIKDELTVNERHAWTVRASFTDTVEVAIEKVGPSDLEAFLDHLGSKLIHGVLGGETKDVIDSAGAVGNGSMLTNVLDAPIAKLSVGNDINAGENLIDARALRCCQ